MISVSRLFLFVIFITSFPYHTWSELCEVIKTKDCINVPSCSLQTSSTKLCEVDYAICMRNIGCPTDMYLSILQSAVNSTLFIIPFHDGNMKTIHIPYLLTQDQIIHLILSRTQVLGDEKVNNIKETNEISEWIKNDFCFSSNCSNNKHHHNNVHDLSRIGLIGESVLFIWTPNLYFSLDRLFDLWKSSSLWNSIEDYDNKNEIMDINEWSCEVEVEAKLFENLMKQYFVKQVEENNIKKFSFSQYHKFRNFLINNICSQRLIKHEEDEEEISNIRLLEKQVQKNKTLFSHQSFSFQMIQVVSMLRRENDRWLSFKRRGRLKSFFENHHYQRFEAIDGSKLTKYDPRLRLYFKNPAIIKNDFTIDQMKEKNSDFDHNNAKENGGKKACFENTCSDWGFLLESSKAGVVGCALSHIQIWKNFVHEISHRATMNSPSASSSAMISNPLLLVMEDDAVLLCEASTLFQLLQMLLEPSSSSSSTSSSTSSSFDGVLFLGYHARYQTSALHAWDEQILWHKIKTTSNKTRLIDQDGQTTKYNNKDDAHNQTNKQKVRIHGKELKINILNKINFLGGTFGYIISYRQAERYLNILTPNGNDDDNDDGNDDGNQMSFSGMKLDQKTNTFAIDHFMKERTPNHLFYETSTRLVHSQFAYSSSSGSKADSDII